jgi:hypothetical protein
MLATNLTSINYASNIIPIKRRFKISQKQLSAVDSESPLEDILTEKAAVLVQ